MIKKFSLRKGEKMKKLFKTMTLVLSFAFILSGLALAKEPVAIESKSSEGTRAVFTINVRHAVDSTPIPNALVRIANATGTIISEGVTNADGRYQFSNAMGTYFAQVSQDGFVTQSTQVQYPNTFVNLVEIQYHSVAVRNAIFNEPVSQATVRILNIRGQLIIQGTTNAQGEYKYPATLASGRYIFQVSKSSYITQTKQFTILNGSLSNINISLIPENGKKDIN